MLYIEDTFYTKQMLTDHPVCRLDWLTDPAQTVVAVCVKDTAAWIAFCLYMKQMHGTVVPLHPDLPEAGARRLAAQAGCDYLVYADFQQPIRLAASTNRPGGLIQFSSGTTGDAKVIHRTWASIDEELAAYGQRFPLTPTTGTIVACPTSHSFGLICGVLATLARGATPIILENLSPKHILHVCQAHPNAVLYAGPGLVYLLSQFKQQLFAVMISGMTVPTVWFEAIRDVTDHLLQQYGCSEIGCIALHPAPKSAQAIGYPLPHLTIQTGTIDEPAELKVKAGDQWIGTKDLMGQTSTGELLFLSRLDEMINVSGLSVYPADVEDVLLRHDAVEEAVVFKRTDRLQGERVCVQVVSSATEDALRTYCREQLAPHQCPSDWAFVPAIEKLPNGKISRVRLGVTS